MKRGRRLPICLLLTVILAGAAIVHKGGIAERFPVQSRPHSQWGKLYAALPLSFEANRGQTDPQVDFLARGQGYTLFLTPHEAVLTLKHATSGKGGKPVPASALHLELQGANPHPGVAGAEELPGKANYFIGNDPAKWHTKIPTYGKVRYQRVYPGIDLVYYGTRDGQLENDFVVAPGAEPASIALKIAADETSRNGRSEPKLQLASNGDLMVKLAEGDVVLHKPVAYQIEPGVRSLDSGVQNATGDRSPKSEVNNRKSQIANFRSQISNLEFRVGSGDNRQSTIENRKSVEVQYVLEADHQVRFKLGAYDHQWPVVIDPFLQYASFVGGTGGDVGYGLAVDANLDAYVAGSTNSTNFPTTGSPFQSASQGGGDAFVFKINSAGTQLLYSTYLGGSGSDAATAIAVFAGDAFITGNTTSTNFPAKVQVANQNPFQLLYGGDTDAFVAQLGTDGSTLVYSSYLGGSGADYGQGIAVDSSGDAYVTGSTQSNNFPIANAYQPSNSGSSDAFVAEVNVTGEALVYSTYLGGTSTDVGQAIQVDSSGNAYVAGYTYSTNFPVAGALQGTNAGSEDAFVTEVKSGGSSLVFSTYLGGAGNDGANAIALDSTGIYVAGFTGSQNFPVTTGAFQPSLRGPSNAFVTKLSSAGSGPTYSTYLGGTGTDQANGIAISTGGIANVVGYTQSSDFPTVNPIQAVLGLNTNNQFCGTAPCADAFVSQLNASGSSLAFSSYLGGNGPDFGQAVGVDVDGDIYLTGSTSSTNFPAIYGGYKTALNGTVGNAFVAKIAPSNDSAISIVPSSVNFGSETLNVASPYQQVTLSNMSTAPLTIANITVTPLAGNVTSVFTVPNLNSCIGILAAGGGSCILDVAFTPQSTGSVSTPITITDNNGGAPGSQQTITLTGSGVAAATSVTVQPTALSFASTPVGTTSAPQTVTVTNTGSNGSTEPLNITKISTGTTNDFTETDTCLTAPNFGMLQVNQSCTISVFFQPTASGTRSASLTISDNATGSPQSVSLTGIGAAAFSLSSPSAVNPVLIGSTQTTFTIVANGPTSFNGAISLTCSAGATCAFNPTPIFVGSSSTLTISQLSPQTTNPYPFTVTGTSGTQTYNLNLNLGFEDFTLTATPPIQTIQAGSTAAFTINVNPLNGFNQAVLLECFSGQPPASQCNWSQNPVTPNGTSPASTTLNITTEKFVQPTGGVPRWPGGKLPPLIMGLLTLIAAASLALGRRHEGRRLWLSLRLGIITIILGLDLVLVACRSGILNIQGTTTGNYSVQIQGTLKSNTNVLRYTTLNVAVTASPGQ